MAGSKAGALSTHQKPIATKREPSLTMVVLGTDGSSISLTLPTMPLGCAPRSSVLKGRTPKDTVP